MSDECRRILTAVHLYMIYMHWCRVHARCGGRKHRGTLLQYAVFLSLSFARVLCFTVILFTCGRESGYCLKFRSLEHMCDAA